MVFNLFITISANGMVSAIERGDFSPESPANKEIKKVDFLTQSAYIQWPTDPENTGAINILKIMNLKPSPRIKVRGFGDNESQKEKIKELFS